MNRTTAALGTTALTLGLAGLVGTSPASADPATPPAGLPSSISCSVSGPGGILSRSTATYQTFTSWQPYVGDVTTTAYRRVGNVGVASIPGAPTGATNRVSPALSVRSESGAPETIRVYVLPSVDVEAVSSRNYDAYLAAYQYTLTQTQTVPTTDFAAGLRRTVGVPVANSRKTGYSVVQATLSCTSSR